MNLEQAQALYDEWKQSGETQRVFLARKQLKQSVFNNHYKNLNILSREKEPHEPLQMLPVNVLARAGGSASASQELSVQFSNGNCLRFPVNTSVEYLSRLIGAMESRRAC